MRSKSYLLSDEILDDRLERISKKYNTSIKTYRRRDSKTGYFHRNVIFRIKENTPYVEIYKSINDMFADYDMEWWSHCRNEGTYASMRIDYLCKDKIDRYMNS